MNGFYITDIIALKFTCCERYYPCYKCHEAHAQYAKN
ncbi:hypothetical protein FCT18_20820 [Lysinibacillus sphaericus]|nr:hypothetical protein FCT18_20820 [Lysinibacillus sphaericus]